ncbi:hypothetical protein DB346_11515 [Verrucomicrobia bacterium LW23]|nr:hypothetical protein DB346_11515 [Verrucomicrobia bacterium LW23]
MKLAAVYLVFKDEPFVPASFAAMYPVVDAICATTGYDRNLDGKPLEPDATVQRLLSLPDPDNKLRITVTRNNDWLPGQDAPARLRNAAIALAPEADYYLIIDADEVYPTDILQRAWEEVQRTQWAGYRIRSWTYFKSWNLRVDPNNDYRPFVFLRKGFLFNNDRQVNWRCLARYKEYLRTWRKPKIVTFDESMYLHHGSMVGDDARVQTKIRNWSHNDLVDPEWFDKVWKNATPESKNLHPFRGSAGLYPGLKYIPNAELPAEVSKAPWPAGWIEE